MRMKCLRQGITSACAEQTFAFCRGRGVKSDHLRVCGADSMSNRLAESIAGSPPRVRSRRDLPEAEIRAGGITSACAEQTSLASARIVSAWDHLRVCGADDAVAHASGVDEGSPPRVRSRRMPERVRRVQVGITSACAEQTAESR